MSGTERVSVPPSLVNEVGWATASWMTKELISGAPTLDKSAPLDSFDINGSERPMSPARIPEAAVEAAAKAAYEVMPVELFGDDHPVTWEQLGDSLLGQTRKDHELTRAKQALEAAAPHLLTEAWEAGNDAGFTRGAFQGRVVESPNPYRTTK